MKKLISLLLIGTMVVSLAACDHSPGDGIPATEPVEETASVVTEVSEAYPITVTDQAGREVTIEQEPQRLVSCYYITTSLLMALGRDEAMVGIEDNPDYRPIYGLCAPHLLELPWVGTAKVLDVEACLALNPDLVILPLRLQDSAEVLEDLGIDVLLVNPESALDFQHRHRMLDMIRTWSEQTKGAAIVVLHDPVLALNYCDKLMVLNDGEVLDILSPGADPLEKMEQVLNRVYGSISLQLCKNRSGREVLTMLKEDTL